MAASCLRKAQYIGFWFGASCLVPVAVLAAPAFRPAIITGNFWLWLAALVAAMALPLPALAAARRCSGQSNVIAYAFWLKKDPLPAVTGLMDTPAMAVSFYFFDAF